MLAEMRERIKDVAPDEGLAIRLAEIEAGLGALAVYLDMAFAELRELQNAD